jgi:prolipoprotein diacylglyceryltransferase
MPAVVTLAFDPELAIGEVHVRWEAIALAAVLLVALTIWAAGLRARVGRPVPMTDLALVLLTALVGAIAGGRVVHVLDFLDVYTTDLVAALDLGRGSLSLVGAVLGGLAGGAWACRLAGGQVGAWMDAAAVPLLVAIGGGKLAMLLGGAGQGAPWDGDWALVFAGDGPWRALEPAVPAWPSQALEGVWVLLGIPVVVLADRRLAGGHRAGRGLLLLLAVAWWLTGRIVVAATWREVPIAGPLGAEGVASSIALALVMAAAALRTLRGVGVIHSRAA